MTDGPMMTATVEAMREKTVEAIAMKETVEAMREMTVRAQAAMMTGDTVMM